MIESKNAAVVVKYLDYGHMTARFAERVNDYAQNVLSPYLNDHRPCLFAGAHADAKGKVGRTYSYAEIATRYEKLNSLPDASIYLKDSVDIAPLDAIAYRVSDNGAARRLNTARTALFESINKAQTRAP